MRVYTRIMKRTFPCHCTNLRYAAQTLTEIYDRVLAPSGLKVTQYVLLRSILQEEAEQSLTDLAHKLGSDRSTIGRNVRILARDGLVSLSRGSDRREQTVHVTEKGREAVSLATPLWQKSQTAVEEALGEDQLKMLRMFLSQLEEISI
jgi:DNA-binding MarR family transcriptional regulator